MSEEADPIKKDENQELDGSSGEESDEKQDSKKNATPSPKKVQKKEANEVKSPKKPESSNEDSEDEDDDEEEEVKKGLLDLPLEMSGTRERKKVQRLDVSFATPAKQYDIPEGKGTKLGDCPRVDHQLCKTHSDDLKHLHKILFSRQGSGNEIKKNIRKFSGFSFEKNSADYERKKANLEKLTIPNLKQVCEILDLERKGTKEELSVKVMDFLLSPQASGKSLPKSKKRSSAGTKGEKRKRKASGDKVDKKTKKQPAKRRKKKASSSEEEDEDEEEDEENDNQSEKSEENKVDDDDDEEEEDENEEEEEKPKPKKKAPAASKRKAKAKESSEDEADEKDDDEDEKDDEDGNANEVSDSDEKPIKKKAKVAPAKKATAAKASKKKNDTKTAEKAKPAKKAKKESSAEEEDEEEDSDNEPVVEKAKGPPDNDEIEQVVKKILEGANLEEITMKKVIKEVCDRYPGHDLSNKKDFIKSTVKSIIS